MHWLRTLLLWLVVLVGTGGAGVASAQSFVQPEEPAFTFAAAPLPPEGFVTMKGTFLRVHGEPSESALLLRLAQHGATSVVRLAEALDVPIGDTIHVYVATSDAQFWEMQPGRPPTWADGTAYPGMGAIYLRSPKLRGGQATPLETVLEHELVHILLGRSFWPRPVPDWLQEGMAQVKSGEFGPETSQQIARGMVSGGLLELEEITRRFPSDPLRAQLAYAQSADLVAWLQAEYGPETHRTLVHELAAGADIRAAIRHATGESLEKVDKAWRSRLDTGVPLSVSAVLNENLFWGIAAVMLLVGGVLRRRQFRRRLAEMEEEERQLDAMLATLMADRPGA